MSLQEPASRPVHGQGCEDRAVPGPLPANWAAKRYLALDFETTGLDPRRDRVVEIGALAFEIGEDGSPREIDRLSALVDPGMPISPAARAVNGIKDEELAGAPAFAALATELLDLARGAIVVAHNAPFDLSFLKVELERAGLPPHRGRVFDTRLLAKAAFPGRPGYRLTDLAAAFGIDSGDAHRALDDARTCMRLFAICAKKLTKGKEE